MSNRDTVRSIREHILRDFLFTSDETALDDQASFLEEGIIDSTGILELVLFVEEEFGIAVNDEDVVPENFDSVLKLARYIETRLEESNAAGTSLP